MTPVILLVASLCYLGVFVAFRLRPDRLKWLGHPPAITWLLTGVASIAVLVTTARSPFWSGSTEIAWTGLDAEASGQDLRVGGGDDSVIGWPNGAFAPILHFSGSRVGEIEISGGAGFVRVADGRVLNGVELRLDAPVQVHGLAIELQRSWWFWRQIAVRAPGGAEPLSTFPMSSTKKDRVLDLAVAVNPDVVQLRADGNSARAGDLERWAAGLRLLHTAEGEYRVLDPDDPPVREQVPAGTRLVVTWASGSLPLEIHAVSNHLKIYFPPPWRLASPLPPSSDGHGQIVVTDQLVPGDTALLLPLGHSLAGFRRVLPLVGDQFAECVQPSHDRPFALRPVKTEGPAWSEVTCEQDVKTGRAIVNLATVRDLPSWRRGLIMLGVVWFSLGFGLFVTSQRIRADDLWIIDGIVTTIWLLLLYRCQLALRYAADPAHLDGLAISGLAYALAALTVVPSVVLMVAPMWRDQYITFRQGDRPYLWLAGLGLWLAFASIFQLWAASSLWPNLPPTYHVIRGAVGLVKYALLVGGAYVAFLVSLCFLYFLDPTQLRLKRWLRWTIGGAHLCVRVAWQLIRTVVIGPGSALWRSMIGGGRASRSGAVTLRSQSTGPTGQRGFWWWYAWLVGFGLILLVLARFLPIFTGNSKTIQSVIAPILFCWMPAVLLLSARTVFTIGNKQPVAAFRATLVIVTIMAISIFVFPFVVDDVGGIVDTFSVMLAVAILLLLGWRHRPIALVPILIFVVVAALAVYIYAQINVVVNPLSKVGQTASARLLIWRNGMDIQQSMPWARVAKAGNAPLSVSFRRLSEAMEHTHENKMMAHEGAYTGLGFAAAPTRLSNIRQDTLQYDSTFSFFVMGDSGLAGGLCLLLVYAMPLVLVLISGRALFDVGHGVATMVGFAFLMAALFHAGMNLGNLPFTGRNLPFLSVNSPSDLLLWTILMGLAVQALLWRVTGHSTAFAVGADSLLTAGTAGGREPLRRYAVACAAISAVPLALLVWTAATGVGIVRDRSLDDGISWSRLLEEVDDMIARGELAFHKGDMKIVAAQPIPTDTLLGQEIAAFNELSDDEKLEGAVPHGPVDFKARLRRVRSLGDYDRMMNDLRALNTGASRRSPSLFAVSEPDEFADMEETIRNFDPDYRLHANPSYNAQTIFHAESNPERFPGISLRDGQSGEWVLRGNGGVELAFADRPAIPTDARDITAGQKKGDLTVVNDSGPSMPRAMIYLRYYPLRQGARQAVLQTYQFARVEIRKDGLYFAPERFELDLLRKGQLPAVHLSRGVYAKMEAGDVVTTRERLNQDLHPRFVAEHNRRGALVGPAWARGRWTTAYDPDPLVPWTRYLGGAMFREWRALGPAEAARRYGTLSLDRGLQAAAQGFVADHGRNRHSELLARAGSREALPPRIALSILDLPSGEVLAVGGWPRMNSGRQWIKDPNGDVPSADWLEAQAPSSLRRRYAGDRNFDKMIMGSSTKPILAAAALAVHKTLDQQLAVHGGEGQEQDVFGIHLNRPWHVENSRPLGVGDGWADFKSYLARSDNRYHIRLGFLALAQPDEHYHVATGGKSASTVESMDRGASAWGQYPKFGDALGFSQNRPNDLRQLQESDFATKLSSMFGVGIRRGDVSRHYSLWTGNEADDKVAASDDERRRRLRFSAIAPEATQFAFDRLDHSRKYVSFLLGGDENMWANVEFAAAFATCVQGIPVTAHITTAAPTKSQREEFEEIARKLRPGLEAVVTHKDGTAHTALTSTGALPLLDGVQGYKVYGKTGTLAQSAGRFDTSRFVVAIVRQDASGKIVKGVVMSMVIERGQIGMAARWMGEFMVRHWNQLRTRLT